MALLQAIASLWPLLKEFYKGKRLDDEYNLSLIHI